MSLLTYSQGPPPVAASAQTSTASARNIAPACPSQSCSPSSGAKAQTATAGGQQIRRHLQAGTLPLGDGCEIAVQVRPAQMALADGQEVVGVIGSARTKPANSRLSTSLATAAVPPKPWRITVSIEVIEPTANPSSPWYCSHPRCRGGTSVIDVGHWLTLCRLIGA
jgi:hypothetical protein